MVRKKLKKLIFYSNNNVLFFKKNEMDSSIFSCHLKAITEELIDSNGINPINKRTTNKNQPTIYQLSLNKNWMKKANNKTGTLN